MKIVCQNCWTQFSVNDDSIPPDGRIVECINCRNSWRQTAAPDNYQEFLKQADLLERTVDDLDRADTQDTTISQTDEEPETSHFEIEKKSQKRVAYVDPAKREDQSKDHNLLTLDYPPDVLKVLREEAEFAKQGWKTDLPEEAESTEEVPPEASVEIAESPSEVSDVKPPQTIKQGSYLIPNTVLILAALCALAGIIYTFVEDIGQAYPAAEPLLSRFSAIIESLREAVAGSTRN